MRKYDKKNKRNIEFILFIGLIIIIIFSYFVHRVVSVAKIEYNVLSGSVLYDIDKNMIKTDNDGKIKMKWGSKYYLEVEDKNYMLGTNSVVYTPSNGNISLYGKFYEIKSDAVVEIQQDETKLESSVISRFYKIADRKYLLVSSNIYTESKELDTANYLIVELDKLGNATLNNNEINVKTFKETNIITNDYTFDIANEVLIYGDNKIDLKKIIGSTNEYESKDLLVDENNKDGDGTGENGDAVNNANNVNNNTTTYRPPANGDTRNNTVVKETVEVSKRTSVIRVIPGISSLSIDYVVYDPKDEYSSVYVELVNQNNNTSTTVSLNKKSTNINISDLSPNTKYKLFFYYTYYEGNDLKKNNYSVIDITTKTPVISISLNNINASNIGYVIKLDDKYNINSSVVEVIVDGSVIATDNKNSIGNVNNYSGNIEISDYDLIGKVITVKLANISFDGYDYRPDAYYKFSY